MPKPDSCWVPGGDFVGQPALVGAKAGMLRRGRMEGSGAAPVSSPPWHPGSRRCFCGWVAARLRPRAASEPPAAPSVVATATTRAASRAGPRTVLAGPMPNLAAALTLSRAQLDEDMGQPPCTYACTSTPIPAVGACPDSGAGVRVTRDGRMEKLGLLWVNRSCPWAALADGFLPSSRALVKSRGATLGAVLAAPWETPAGPLPGSRMPRGPADAAHTGAFSREETPQFHPDSPIQTSPNCPAPSFSTSFSDSRGTSHSSCHHGFCGFWVRQGLPRRVQSPSELPAAQGEAEPVSVQAEGTGYPAQANDFAGAWVAACPAHPILSQSYSIPIPSHPLPAGRTSPWTARTCVILHQLVQAAEGDTGGDVVPPVVHVADLVVLHHLTLVLVKVPHRQ